jgi:PBP1b-binding outer membrane lipoprotein LpoB
MKKLTLAAAILLSTLAFTSCKKENVQPTTSFKAGKLADKSNLSQADDIAPVDAPAGDKSNLSQADYQGGN